jgi:oxygen-dependent protoporphyrinogen oxidase
VIVVRKENTRIVIVGAGIAGLSIAWAIRRRDPDADLVVLERGPRTGGNIRTERVDGYVCESGPDGFMDSAPATIALVGELGLASRLLASRDEARRRFLFSNGRLTSVPTSLTTFLKTPLLSIGGKLRVMCEPFSASCSDDDESILNFARRRIGDEAANLFVDPMVSGIYGGDAGALSLRACFPTLWKLEKDHGGLIRGLVAAKRSRRRSGSIGGPSGRLSSFVGGMSELTDALTRDLGASVHTSSPVGALDPRHSKRDATSPQGYVVSTPLETFHADAIVLAGPAEESARIVRDFDPVLSQLLTRIQTVPIAVVCLGFDEASIESRCRLDGFGFLVPRNQGIRILGALWETSIYQHRAPAGKVLLRVMVGGARDPEAVQLSDDRLLDIVRHDLARAMGLSAVPEMVRVIRHPRGIPQYVRGHIAILDQIAHRLEHHPGLFVAGNSYRGVSINSCVAEADTIAESVLQAAAVPAEPVHEATAGAVSS